MELILEEHNKHEDNMRKAYETVYDLYPEIDSFDIKCFFSDKVEGLEVQEGTGEDAGIYLIVIGKDVEVPEAILMYGLCIIYNISNDDRDLKAQAMFNKCIDKHMEVYHE